MRTRMDFLTMAMQGLLVAALSSRDLMAQTTLPDNSTSSISREEFDRRLKEIEQRHQEDLAARDKAIADLRDELAKRPIPLSEQQLAEERAYATQQSLNKMLADIDANKRTELTPRMGISFNPDFAVISDFLGTWSNQRSNNAYNRFDVREVELDLRAAVDPRVDAVAILAIARDVENPVFPEFGEELSGPETSVEAEEVYLFFHDFGIPNLTAKLGRFHVRFGRQNILHLHDLPTSDPPLVNQAFLAPEALVDSGLSFSYVIPNPWNQYFEIVGEVLSGEGGSNSESPVFTGDLSVDSPAVNLHALWNVDIAKDWNLELGASAMWGHREPDNSLDAWLFGGDLTLLHTDPTGGFNNFMLQSEFIHGIVDQVGAGTQYGCGMYALAQQQLSKDWYIGTRVDWTQNPNHDMQDAWAVSPYFSWYWSEFLRFRVEYQHREGNFSGGDADVVMFQVTWICGAHPPHPYWTMR
jgi:hypothetical protein